MQTNSVKAAGSGFFHHLAKWVLAYILIIVVFAGLILGIVNFSDEYFDLKFIPIFCLALVRFFQVYVFRGPEHVKPEQLNLIPLNIREKGYYWQHCFF